MNTINKDELLKSSKWIRFIFMVIYALIANFIALPIVFALSFIQFIFVLFTSKENQSISNASVHVIEFFNDSLSFLLFYTEEKPFPFKNNDSQEDVIDAEVSEDVSEDVSEEAVKVDEDLQEDVVELETTEPVDSEPKE
tara:strand:+ start:718 stop:1134 length:417 start_codon:yes stop_codon:yes gene_type:complete